MVLMSKKGPIRLLVTKILVPGVGVRVLGHGCIGHVVKTYY